MVLRKVLIVLNGVEKTIDIFEWGCGKNWYLRGVEGNIYIFKGCWGKYWYFYVGMRKVLIVLSGVEFSVGSLVTLLSSTEQVADSWEVLSIVSWLVMLKKKKKKIVSQMLLRETVTIECC